MKDQSKRYYYLGGITFVVLPLTHFQPFFRLKSTPVSSNSMKYCFPKVSVMLEITT